MRSNLPRLASRIAIAILVISLCGSTQQFRSQSADHPLRISSMGSPFGLQGEFTGYYKIEDDAIRIFFSETDLYDSVHCPYKGRRAVLRIQLGLATETPETGKWHIETKSEPLALGIIMSPGDRKEFEGLDFRIPIKPNTDLSNSWIVIDIQDEALDPIPGHNEPSYGSSFAHSCRNIFKAKSPTDQPQAGSSRSSASNCS
jgi:hypothetical protein